MKITVGLLYSTQRFLDLTKKYEIDQDSFINNNLVYLVANPNSIIDICLNCNWIFIEDNIVKLTKPGIEIIECQPEYKKLRVQLKHYILNIKPSWSLTFHYGRIEASNYFPPPVLQCFKEANLLDTLSLDVIDWWNILGDISRNEKDNEKLETGQLGEKLSYFYENDRINKYPHWQSIDSNFSGYDLLSKVNIDSNINLLIEVKTSINQKRFFITKNEWETAIESDYHIFHFWILEPYLELYTFDHLSLKPYIPLDTDKGVWTNCQITLNSDDLMPFITQHNMDLNRIKKQVI